MGNPLSRLAECPARFKAAHSDGLVTGFSRDFLLAYHDEVCERLRLVEAGIVQSSALDAAHRAASLVRLAEALEPATLNQPPDVHAVLAEAFAALRPDQETEVLMLPGEEPGPMNLLLSADDVSLLLVWDGRRFSMGDHAFRGMALHEASHGHPHVAQAAQSMNGQRRRSAEILADVLAMALGGPGYTASFGRIQQAAAFPLDRIGPTHPSVATRAHFMHMEASYLWGEDFRHLVRAFLDPVRAPWAAREEYFHQEAQGQLTSFRLTVRKHQIRPEDVYEARVAEGIPTQRARLAAAELET